MDFIITGVFRVVPIEIPYTNTCQRDLLSPYPDTKNKLDFRCITHVSFRWFARGRARRHFGAAPIRGVVTLEGLLERRHDLLGRHWRVALSVAGDDVEQALDPACALAVVLVGATSVETALVAGRDHVDHVVVHTGSIHVASLLHESPGAVLTHHLACLALARRLSRVPRAVHDV